MRPQLPGPAAASLPVETAASLPVATSVEDGAGSSASLCEGHSAVTAAADVNRGTSLTTEQAGPSTSRSGVPQESRFSSPICLDLERQTLRSRGLSEDVITTLQASRKSVTSAIYSKIWKRYCSLLGEDIRELIEVDDVMEDGALRFGPNGGLVYCMEYFANNFDWLESCLGHTEDDYILFDCPGQIELYTHLPVMKYLVDQLQQWEFRVCGVFLVDSQFMVESFKVSLTAKQ
ncbi:unnamed protein product [Ranitomeya imitator]|uniref:GPN-loop GTPase 3 n=1 Tax=Ranitomeya imitator TaxID=111125 RepID=A0ABN9KWL9_9NEOB|nr:unnamed protein product [Ranitomeya imitator]